MQGHMKCSARPIFSVRLGLPILFNQELVWQPFPTGPQMTTITFPCRHIISDEFEKSYLSMIRFLIPLSLYFPYICQNHQDNQRFQ